MSNTQSAGLSRRDEMEGAGGSGLAAAAADNVAQAAKPAATGSPAAVEKVGKNGRINHSVCLWCYNMKVEQMAPSAAAMGLKAIDLITPPGFEALKKHGLVCSMTSGVWGGIEKGLNRRE